MPQHQSDSSEQRDVEEVIRAKVAAHLGTELKPATLALDQGAEVQVDGASADRSVFVEIFARQGTLKGGQRHKIATDALKLITLGRSYPQARLVIAFADDDAAAFATQGTWMAEALSAWKVQVLVVELDDDVREGIRAAQVRQRMVNPSAEPPPGAPAT